LQAITRATHELSPHRLNQRITLPERADRETWRLAETFNELLGRIETSFEEMKRFTANAAHELQTPLTVLRGHVEVALRRPRSELSYRNTLQLLGEELDGMSTMVHNLLVLARLDRDQFIARQTRISLDDLARASVAKFAEKASHKELQIHQRLASRVFIEGHAGLLAEAIDNILENAVKYTDAGAVHLTLENDVTRNEACLVIRDTGPGIPEVALPHLTDRFYRGDGLLGQGAPGSGLGLSIVSQIVYYHHGELAISSLPGVGTTVQLLIPLARLSPHTKPSSKLRDTAPTGSRQDLQNLEIT
jgi:signal transduction histidine kinase